MGLLEIVKNENNDLEKINSLKNSVKLSLEKVQLFAMILQDF